MKTSLPPPVVAAFHSSTEGVFSLFRQGDGELRALVHLAGDGDPSAVGFDDCFDQAQAETQAALGAALVPAVEAQPDHVLLGGETLAGLPGTVILKGMAITQTGVARNELPWEMSRQMSLPRMGLHQAREDSLASAAGIHPSANFRVGFP